MVVGDGRWFFFFLRSCIRYVRLLVCSLRARARARTLASESADKLRWADREGKIIIAPLSRILDSRLCDDSSLGSRNLLRGVIDDGKIYQINSQRRFAG